MYFLPGERGRHPDWDSCCFDYGRDEVIEFLLSNVRSQAAGGNGGGKPDMAMAGAKNPEKIDEALAIVLIRKKAGWNIHLQRNLRHVKIV